jgi:hypothetical protein
VITTTASIYPDYFLSFWFGLVGVWRDSWLYNSFSVWEFPGMGDFVDVR